MYKKTLLILPILLSGTVAYASCNTPGCNNPASVDFVINYVATHLGPQGPTGPAGGILDFADFFALMPADNLATVAVGSAVEFPQDGPTLAGSGITRLTNTTFNLAAIGVYQVMYQVSVSEAGQLVLSLDSVEQLSTVVGRATGTSQIVSVSLIETSAINGILSVNNPTGNSTALTITPLAGGTHPVSAHLVITRLQ